MKINKYPDGSSYVKVPDYGISNEITFRINTYEDLWHLNQLVDAWNFRYNKKPTITIPNLIDAQADRRFNPDESFGLKLVCKFLNGMNANFKIFHPHNPEVVEALMDNVEIIDNTYFIKEVLSTIYCEQNNVERDEGLFYHQKQELYNNLTLFSSDAGGFKPLMKLCDKINWKGHTESASKYRNPQNSKLIQTIDKQDFEGRDILIVDDICVYGGTFKGLSKLLRQRNCGKLYLAVSHMTVQNLGEDPVTDYFDSVSSSSVKVFTTNSKYDEYYVDQHTDFEEKYTPKNLKIIKLF